MDDDLDEFMGYDFAMGADVVKCPYCGVDVPCSLFFDDEVECPKCGNKGKGKANNFSDSIYSCEQCKNVFTVKKLSPFQAEDI